LVVWNSWHGLDAPRARALANLAADVAVVPEAGRPTTWEFDGTATPSSHAWLDDAEAKGLAVLTFGEWRLQRVDEPTRVPWVLPVDVRGSTPFRLLAIWTVQREGWPSYETQVSEAIEAYGPELRDGSTVLAGDLNCVHQGMRLTQHRANVNTLRSSGVESAYHAAHGVDTGVEADATLYWHWNRESPFHCDLAFVPQLWTHNLGGVEVGRFDDWVAPRLSDHVPVIIDVDLPPG
jgi:hypothetical protein